MGIVSCFYDTDAITTSPLPEECTIIMDGFYSNKNNHQIYNMNTNGTWIDLNVSPNIMFFRPDFTQRHLQSTSIKGNDILTTPMLQH